MPKAKATDGYFSLVNASPYDAFLGALPRGLITELKKPNSLEFGRAQPYIFIMQSIQSQEIDAINEHALCFSLIQAIETQQCTVNQAATALLFYTMLKEIKPLCPTIDVTVSSTALIFQGDIKEKDFYITPTSPWIEFAINTNEYYLNKLIIYSFDTEVRGTIHRMPFIGTLFNYSQALYAIKNNKRMLGLFPFFSDEVKIKYHFFPSTSAHGKTLSLVELIFHDIFHAQCESRINLGSQFNLESQQTSRVLWLYFFYELLIIPRYQEVKSPERQLLLSLFEACHDSGVPLVQLQSTLLSGQQLTKEVNALLKEIRGLFSKDELIQGVNYLPEIKKLFKDWETKLDTKTASADAELATDIEAALERAKTTLASHDAKPAAAAPEKISSIFTSAASEPKDAPAKQTSIAELPIKPPSCALL